MARPKQDKKKVSKSVTLNENTIKILTILGEGNVSAGVEEAVKGYIAFRAMTNQPPIEVSKDKNK